METIWSSWQTWKAERICGRCLTGMLNFADSYRFQCWNFLTIRNSSGVKPGPTAIKKKWARISYLYYKIVQSENFIYWMQLHVFVGYENKTRTQKLYDRKDICRERTTISCSIRVCHWTEPCGICLSWYSGVCSTIRSNYSDASLKYCWKKCWGLIILIRHH